MHDNFDDEENDSENEDNLEEIEADFGEFF